MASKLFERGSYLGSDYLYECTIGTWDFTPTEQQAEQYLSALRRFMVDSLEALDDRLWWQPETSEIYWEDDGSDRDEPDDSGFDSWWDEKISEFNETYVDNGGNE